MVYYKKFCCCFTTKTGVKIIAKSLIFCFFAYLLALSIYAGVQGFETSDPQVVNINGINITSQGASPVMVFGIEAMSTYYASLGIPDDELKTKAIVSVIICIFGIFMNLLLLHGSEKNRGSQILPWLILTMFHLVIDLFIRFGLLVASYYDPKGWIIVKDNLVSGILMYIFGFYFWDVVLSRYRDIPGDGNDNEDLVEIKSEGRKSSSSSHHKTTYFHGNRKSSSSSSSSRHSQRSFDNDGGCCRRK